MTSFRSTCALVVLWAALLVPIPASGAADFATGTVSHQVWMAPTTGEVNVLVSTTLPATTKLPVTVRIPVPPGMAVEWAGEIAGEDPSRDVERPYVLKEGEGGTYAEFVIEEFRKAQIDVAGENIPTGKAAVSVQFEFVQSVPSEEAFFSVRIPPRAFDVGIDPLPVGEPEIGPVGEALYTLPSQQLKPGDSTRVSVSYRLKRVDPTPVRRGRISDVLAIGLSIAALIAAAVLAVLLHGRTNHKQPKSEWTER